MSNDEVLTVDATLFQKITLRSVAIVRALTSSGLILCLEFKRQEFIENWQEGDILQVHYEITTDGYSVHGMDNVSRGPRSDDYEETT
jgi:hypothetical protein